MYFKPEHLLPFAVSRLFHYLFYPPPNGFGSWVFLAPNISLPASRKAIIGHKGHASAGGSAYETNCSTSGSFAKKLP